MSTEEIIGLVKMIQQKADLILETLTRIEKRQIEVKKEIEAEPVQGSFASTEPEK